MARLILDTCVLVGAVRGRVDLADLSDEDDMALPAVVVAEYLAGVRDANPRSVLQRAFLDEVLALVPIVDYDQGVAEHHAALLAHVRDSGEPRGAHDLIIAATARASGRTLVSTDKRARFDELPGVTLRVLDVG
ncbi:PIN domain-containing protein [Actinokineospora sp.]|uniref:PIN domain-containing protein n=1 Tax=Actinokineospora sp. TaxID=1872133 RepID=UPI003D6BC422